MPNLHHPCPLVLASQSNPPPCKSPFPAVYTLHHHHRTTLPQPEQPPCQYDHHSLLTASSSIITPHRPLPHQGLPYAVSVPTCTKMVMSSSGTSSRAPLNCGGRGGFVMRWHEERVFRGWGGRAGEAVRKEGCAGQRASRSEVVEGSGSRGA